MERRKEVQQIIHSVLEASKPGPLVSKAIAALPSNGNGRTILLAVGKAAFAMAEAALRTPGFTCDQAMVITKYDHVDHTALAALPDPIRARLVIREAGHPVPDVNSYQATKEAIAMVTGLADSDRVLFLVSGGGSALFEKPLVPPEEMVDINKQLLASGADIEKINTIRKRLSAVKGGRFAQLCAPAQVITIALSDVLSNAPEQIASGPACPDSTTCEQAMQIAKECRLRLSPAAAALLKQETPKQLPNATVRIIGGMTFARAAATQACRQLGYRVWLFRPAVTCQAQAAGRFWAQLAKKAARQEHRIALVAGGETVVTLGKEHGLGGRNQEAALTAALEIQGEENVCFFSLGTDGTDGPTDAAGGYADGTTVQRIDASGKTTAAHALAQHDAYHALAISGDLLITGPSGTNVNDVSVALVSGGTRGGR